MKKAKRILLTVVIAGGFGLLAWWFFDNWVIHNDEQPCPGITSEADFFDRPDHCWDQ